MAGKKNKDPGVDRAWLQDLQTGKPAKLYLFHGPETFRKEAALGILKKRIVEPGTEDFSLMKLEGKGLTREMLSEAVDAPAFLSERKLIVVRDFDVYKADWIEELLDRLGDDICLVFYYDTMEYKPDARTKLYKKLQTLAVTGNFQEATDRELAEWIAARFRSRKRKIAPADVQYLTFRCGRLMQNLLMEIGKLCDYPQPDGSPVTRELIDRITIRVPEAQVFDMTDALSENRFSDALRYLNDMEAAREEAIPTLAMIGRQIRLLYGARLCLDRNQGLREIMDVTKLHSEYPAKKLRAAAARLTLDSLREALALCLEADVAMKSTRTDEFAILRELLAKLQFCLHGQK